MQYDLQNKFANFHLPKPPTQYNQYKQKKVTQTGDLSFSIHKQESV